MQLEKKLHKCRYCSNAFDYNGEGEDFLCTADAPCGGNGAGVFYDASKAKRLNKCPYFEYNPYDVFGLDEYGNYRQYKPRAEKDFEQIKIEV